jgi:hypothetical protein
MVLGGVILATLFYFAVVDYLYIGRMAAYIFIAEARDAPLELPSPEGPSAVDSTELILSDLPFDGAPA